MSKDRMLPAPWYINFVEKFYTWEEDLKAQQDLSPN